jgi:hypothetical protein
VPFAIGYVQATLFTPDPNRAGLAAQIVVTVTNVPLALIFYELFKVINRRVALLDAFFILVATAIEAAGLLHQFAPLVLLGSAPQASGSSTTELEKLAFLTGHLAQFDYTIYTVFFGLDILCLSYLLLRSKFLPSAIAILLAVDGFGYLIYSFANILNPSLAGNLTPWIQLPAPLAEGALSLWLLAFGVRVAQRTKLGGGNTYAVRPAEALL